jgi:hypothetical protein
MLGSRIVPTKTIAVEALVVVTGYFALAVLATWPLARYPLSGFYGFPNDNFGGIWLNDFLHGAYHGPAAANVAPDLQAPFGLAISDQGLQPMDRLAAFLFGGAGDGLGAYNLQIFTSFVLAGCTMYLLTRYVTGNRLAAGVAGVIFAFSPFHLAQAMQYPALSSIQWIPLFLLALLVALRSGRWRDAVLAGLAFALVTVTSYYHAWFAAWMTIGILIVFSVRAIRTERRAHGRLERARVGRFIGRLAGRSGLALGVVLLVAGPLVRSSASTLGQPGVGTRPIEEAVRYSARPWMLVTPPHDNPVFGDLTDGFVLRHLYDSPVYEQSLYIGWTVLLLVVLGLWTRWRRDDPDRIRFTRPLAVGGAVTGLLIMVGPYLPLDPDYWRLWATPGETTHVPSLGSLMFEVASIFRFFSRAFVILSVCLAVLAAIGLTRLYGRFPTRSARVALTAAVLGLIGVEFANAPPRVFAREVDPPWVRAVATLPAEASIAQYPLVLENSPRSLYYLYWQRRHRHATVNPIRDPEAQAFAGEIASLDNPASGEALARKGIDYVVVHTSLPPATTPPYQPLLPSDAMPAATGSLNPWLQRTGDTPGAIIYRVLALPRETSGALITFADGWGAPEPRATGQARWLLGDRGTVMLTVAGRPRNLTVTFGVASFAQRRRLTLTLDGSVIGRYEIDSRSRRQIVARLTGVTAGAHTLALETSPGAESIGARLGNADTRAVSIDVSDPPVLVSEP